MKYKYQFRLINNGVYKSILTSAGLCFRVVKITDQNSEIFSDTIDLSQTHNKINRSVSADDLVNPESYKNPTSTDPNSNVPSVYHILRK